MREEVEKVLAEIRPFIQADGGDVQLVDVENGVVKLHLMGACHGCPSALMTLHMGIERRLRAMVPGVERVEAV
jgi:Fe-S cluster biogenesis protein NfuA